MLPKKLKFINAPVVQQTAMLSTGQWSCHMTLSPVKNTPPPAKQPFIKILFLLIIITAYVLECLLLLHHVFSIARDVMMQTVCSDLLCTHVFKVTRCTNIAAVKVAELTELIHRALESDAAARVSGQVGAVTSTGAFTAAANVEMSHAQTVDMEAAQKIATTVLNVSASDDDSTSSSSVCLISVTDAAVIEPGTSLCSLFTFTVDALANEV